MLLWLSDWVVNGFINLYSLSHMWVLGRTVDSVVAQSYTTTHTCRTFQPHPVYPLNPELSYLRQQKPHPGLQTQISHTMRHHQIKQQERVTRYSEAAPESSHLSNYV